MSSLAPAFPSPRGVRRYSTEPRDGGHPGLLHVALAPKLAFPFTPVSAVKLAISTVLGVASIHYLRLGRREHDVSKLV